MRSLAVRKAEDRTTGCHARTLASHARRPFASQIFGLITSVPERVTQWFGQAGDRMGEDQETTRIAGALVSRTEGAAGKFGMMGMMASRGGGDSSRLSKAPGNVTPGGATPGDATTPSKVPTPGRT